MILKPTPEKLV